jgi:hypothetical protein
MSASSRSNVGKRTARNSEPKLPHAIAPVFAFGNQDFGPRLGALILETLEAAPP